MHRITTPSVTLIIAVYNNWTWLEIILKALERQTFKHFDVIIADDGSSEETQESISQFKKTSSLKITLITHERNGWQKEVILNKAIKASTGEYLIFIDGDCIPCKHFTEDHMRLRRKRTIITGRRVTIGKKMSSSLSANAINRDKDYARELRLKTFVSLIQERRFKEIFRLIRLPFQIARVLDTRKHGVLGCNFSLWKSDIKRVNGFDQRFKSPGTGEDSDLEARLHNIGIKTLKVSHWALMFHRLHKKQTHFDQNSNDIYQYHIANNISYTKYGIEQQIFRREP